MKSVVLGGGILQGEFKQGRIHARSEGRELMTGRGIHGYFESPEGACLTTEAEWTLETEQDRALLAFGRLAFLPIQVMVRLERRGSSDLEIELTYRTEEELLLRAAGMTVQLSGEFRGWASGRWRTPFPCPMEGEQFVWAGFPPLSYLAAVAPGSGMPDLRIEMDPDSPLKEIRVSTLPSRLGGHTFEWVSLEAERSPIRLSPGSYRLFKGLVRLLPEPPEPFYYPRDIFSRGELRRVLLYSESDRGHTLHTAEMIRQRLPHIQMGEGRGPVQVRVILPRGSSAGEGEEAALEDPPSSTRELFQKRLWDYRRDRIDLYVQTVDNVYQSFGLRCNLLALALGTRYKAKYDWAGCSMFVPNAPRLILKRKLQSMLSGWKGGLGKLVKIAQFGLVLSCLPLLAVIQFVGTRAARKRSRP